MNYMTSSFASSEQAYSKPDHNIAELKSKSALMKDIYIKALELSNIGSNIIIVGETGSGKKHLGRFIHQHSSRKEGPFHWFYCVDINESDYKDAFWEHIQIMDSHIILTYDAIEKASYGFLFLDQFCELEESFMIDIIQSFKQGCNQLFRYNTSATPRLILSIDHNAYKEILRKDIWKTLLELTESNVIMLPPLRERKEDIPELIEHFLGEIRRNNEEWRNIRLTEEAFNKCYNYSWPGNILQLKNALLQGAMLSTNELIDVQHLPISLKWSLPYMP
jgi:DNA-binding NtrC family response regulator